LLSFGELLEERLGRIEFKGKSWFIDSNSCGLLSHLLPLEITFEGIEEESVVWYAVPVENLLLLLCPNAIVLVQEIKETTLWLFEGGIGARLQVSQIGKDTLLKLLRVLYWSSKGLKSEGKAANNVGTGNVKEVVPTKVSLDSLRVRRATYHNTQETYSPVGKRNRRMY